MQPPYPISGIPAPLIQGRPGPMVFDDALANAINEARMHHLYSLGLPFDGKRVLDVGSGVGHLARFLRQWGGRVTSIDGRKENVEIQRQRLPDTDAHVLNVETDSLTHLGRFDIVFCYGLLYHLENPIAGLRNIASVCDHFLALETIVCDCSAPVLGITDEPNVTWNQSLGSFGCRPSPSWVTMILNRIGFPYVYAPNAPPNHEDFR